MPGRALGKSVNRIPKRTQRTRSQRNPSSYGNNRLTKPDVSRPGASLGGRNRPKVRTVNTPSRVTRNTKPRTQTRRTVPRTARVGNRTYVNHGIGNRNPMDD